MFRSHDQLQGFRESNGENIPFSKKLKLIAFWNKRKCGKVRNQKAF